MSRNRGAGRQLLLEVLERDNWTCQMPVCLCPAGRAIDPGLYGTQGGETSWWAPSADHIIPHMFGGKRELRNMRAAHALCNQRHSTRLALQRQREKEKEKNQK